MKVRVQQRVMKRERGGGRGNRVKETIECILERRGKGVKKKIG